MSPYQVILMYLNSPMLKKKFGEDNAIKLVELFGKFSALADGMTEEEIKNIVAPLIFNEVLPELELRFTNYRAMKSGVKVNAEEIEIIDLRK